MHIAHHLTCSHFNHRSEASCINGAYTQKPNWWPCSIQMITKVISKCTFRDYFLNIMHKNTQAVMCKRDNDTILILIYYNNKTTSTLWKLGSTN